MGPQTLRMARGGDWAALPLDVLLHLMRVVATDHAADLRGAHLTCRSFRAGAAAALTRLSPPVLDVGAIRAFFPNVACLHLRGLELGPQRMQHLAGLDRQLTALRLAGCTLAPGEAILAVARLQGLLQVELCDVVGPTPAQLDDALRLLTGLQGLQVETRSHAARAPTLRTLGLLPRIRRLSFKQGAPARQALHLTNLAALADLRSLDLRGAGVTNAVLRCLSELTALTEARWLRAGAGRRRRCARLLLPDAFRVSDFGLEGLAPLTRLESLDLSCGLRNFEDDLSDQGMAHLAHHSLLTSLGLGGRSSLTSASLQFLGCGCPRLASLDLARVRFQGGNTAFLWQLTCLTRLLLAGTAMGPQQFEGLSVLTGLRHLDASATGFDDSCCLQLAPLTALTCLALRHVSCQLSNAGLEVVHASCRQLAALHLQGARVSTLGVRRALAAHPRAAMWPHDREHLPRWLNAVHVQLMAEPAPGCHCLRLRHAPEASGWDQTRAVAWAGGVLASHAGLMLLLAVFAIALPVAALAAAAWAAAVAALLRSRRPLARLRTAAGRLEGAVVWAMVGLHAARLPAPPGLPDV
eukprot:scaffold6.g2897.t1